MKNIKAFTLVELLVVIAIIGVVTAIFLSIFKHDKIKVIDGCEYIVTWGHYDNHLTHKGNCTNKIHIYNK